MGQQVPYIDFWGDQPMPDPANDMSMENQQIPHPMIDNEYNDLRNPMILTQQNFKKSNIQDTRSEVPGGQRSGKTSHR